MRLPDGEKNLKIEYTNATDRHRATAGRAYAYRAAKKVLFLLLFHPLNHGICENGNAIT